MLLFWIAIFSLSQAANLVRWAGSPPSHIGFWRLLGAAAIMAAFAFFEHRRGQRLHLATWKRNLPWVFASGLFFFLHLWTYFYAAQNTTIANAMIIFSINPIYTALAAKFFFQDRLTKAHATAFLLAFTGIGLLMWEKLNWGEGFQGNLSALASGVFYTGYILTGKKARHDLTNSQLTSQIYFWTAILFFIAGTFEGIAWTGYPTSTWIAILGTILIPTLLGHVLFTYLLKHLNVTWMSCGKLTEPVLSAGMAFLIFSEIPQALTWVAFTFTTSAVIVLMGPQLRSAWLNRKPIRAQSSKRN